MNVDEIKLVAIRADIPKPRCFVRSDGGISVETGEGDETLGIDFHPMKLGLDAVERAVGELRTACIKRGRIPA